MKLKITVLLITIPLALLLNCGKSGEMISTQLTGTVTFLSGDVKVNDKPLHAGSQVVMGDVITSGDKAIAVIQFSQISVITIKSNTVLKINDLANAGANGKVNAAESFTIDKGAAFHKVMTKGTDYSVGTPTMVAAVRGTAFMVQVKDGVTRVDLLEGELLVTQNNGESLVLTAGQSIISTKDGLSKPGVISKKESEKLSVYNGIRLVPEVDRVVSGNGNSGGELLQGIEVESGEIKSITDTVPGDTSAVNRENSEVNESGQNDLSGRPGEKGKTDDGSMSVKGGTGEKDKGSGDKVAVNTGGKDKKKSSGNKVLNKTGDGTGGNNTSGAVNDKTASGVNEKTGGNTSADKTEEGILSVIRLKNGKEYTGTFTQSGEFVEIVMSGKRIKVKAAEIKEIERYRSR